MLGSLMAIEIKVGILLITLLSGMLVGPLLGLPSYASAQSTTSQGPKRANVRISVLWWAKPVERSEDFSGLSTPVGIDNEVIPSFIDLDFIKDSDNPPKPLSHYDVLVIDDTSFPLELSSFRGELVVTIDGGISTLLYHLTGETREDEWWTFASIPSILWIGAMERGTVESVSPSDDAMIYERSLKRMSSHGIEIVGGPLAVDSSNKSHISVALFNITTGDKHFLWLFLGPYDRVHPNTPRRQTEIIVHFISVLLYSKLVPATVEVRDASPSEFVLGGLAGTSSSVRVDLNLAVKSPIATYLDEFMPRIFAEVKSGDRFDSELELHGEELVTSLPITLPIHLLDSYPHEVNLTITYSIGDETFTLQSQKLTFRPTYSWGDSPTVKLDISPSEDGNSFNLKFTLPKPRLEAKFEGNELHVTLKYPVSEYFPLLKDKKFELRVENEETSETLLSKEIAFGEISFPLNLSYGSYNIKIYLYDGSGELQVIRLKVEAPLSPMLIGGILAAAAVVVAVVILKLRRKEEAEELERILEEGAQEARLQEAQAVKTETEEEGEIVGLEDIQIKKAEEGEQITPKKPVRIPEKVAVTEEPEPEEVIPEELGNLVLTTPSGSSLLIDTTTTVKPGDLSVKGKGQILFSRTLEGWMMEVEGVDAELNGERLEEKRPYRISDGDKLVVWGLEILIQVI